MVDRNAVLAVSVLAVFVAVAGTVFAVGAGPTSTEVGFESEPVVAPGFIELPSPSENQQQSDVKVIASSSGDNGCSTKPVRTPDGGTKYVQSQCSE